MSVNNTCPGSNQSGFNTFWVLQYKAMSIDSALVGLYGTTSKSEFPVVYAHPISIWVPEHNISELKGGVMEWVMA